MMMIAAAPAVVPGPRPAFTTSSTCGSGASTRLSTTSSTTTASAPTMGSCSASRRTALLSRFSDTITKAQQELQAMAMMANSQRPAPSSQPMTALTNQLHRPAPTCKQYSNSSDDVQQTLIPMNTKAAAPAVSAAGATSHAGKRKRINDVANGHQHGRQRCRLHVQLHEEAAGAALDHPVDDAPHHADGGNPSSWLDLISFSDRTAEQQHKQQAELTSTWADFLEQVKRVPDARRRTALIERRRRAERQAVCTLKRTVVLNVPVDISDCAIDSS